MNLIIAESAPNTVIGNIIVVSGAFLILVFLIRKFAWKQITSIFTERAKKISDDIDAAEEAHKTAEVLVQKREQELSGAKDEVANILATANETANQNFTKIVDQAHEEATMLKSHASADIEQERKEALNGVKSDVASISVQIAEKLIGKSLDAEAQSDLINSYLEKMEK